MKRHPALVPLSHDHHHGLVQARRLRRAADDGDAARRLDAASEFAAFFAHETAAHFRDEEELLFPLLAGTETARPLLVEACLQHAALRALVRRLELSIAAGDVPAGLVGEVGELLESHIRLEERRLFPLAEEVVSEDDFDALSLPPRSLEPVLEGSPVVNLTAGAGRGPLWGTASEDLNATLLAWGPEEKTPEHANDQRDVLLVGVDGTGEVRVEGEPHSFGPGRAVLVEKGSTFQVVAGAGGLRYLSVHLRRPALQIASRAPLGGT